MSYDQLPDETPMAASIPLDELAAPDPNREDILYADTGSSNAKDIQRLISKL